MNWYLKCMSQYADFEGRARRREFGFFMLCSMILMILAFVLALLVGEGAAVIVSALAVFGHLVPSFAVTARRLHDLGWSGWWLLLLLFLRVIGEAAAELSEVLSLPFDTALLICFLILLFKNSQPGENQYGPNPKGHRP